jgi:hypothetical protein
MFSRIFSNTLAHFLHRTFSKLQKNDQQTKSTIKRKYLGLIVAPVHKNTNVRLILIVCDVIFCMRAKHIIGDFAGFFSRGPRLFDPEIVLSAGSKK